MKLKWQQTIMRIWKTDLKIRTYGRQQHRSICHPCHEKTQGDRHLVDSQGL